MSNTSAEANCVWVQMRIRQNGLEEETELLALVIIEARRELELL